MAITFRAEETVFNLWKLQPEPYVQKMTEKVRNLIVPSRRIRIFRNDELAAAYILPVDTWIFYAYLWRPYIYPFYSPAGLSLVQHNPPDHLHHRGIWIGHGEVDCKEFFIEQEDAGRIASRRTAIVEQGRRVVLEQRNQWVDYLGTPLVDEDRRIIFTGDEAANIVDHELVLRPAGDKPVVLGATLHGFMCVRTDDRLEPKNGGRLVNANGDENTFGKVAAWVDAHGIIGGRRCGIALYNFPINPVQPMITSSFGWFAAHPFWTASHTLEPGGECKLAFRVVGHDGWPGDIDLNKYIPG